VQPVYAALERDPQTRAFITRIRTLAASLPSPPPVVVPTSCLGPRRAGPSAGPRSPSILNGTYHRLLTADAARTFGAPATGGTEYPLVLTSVLRDGTWTTNDEPSVVGTYTVRDNEVVFELAGDVMRFTFARDHDGTLHLRPILPMDRGDQWIMAGAPWRRVGPPT
jgi:hypothetical protein